MNTCEQGVCLAHRQTLTKNPSARKPGLTQGGTLPDRAATTDSADEIGDLLDVSTVYQLSPAGACEEDPLFDQSRGTVFSTHGRAIPVASLTPLSVRSNEGTRTGEIEYAALIVGNCTIVALVMLAAVGCGSNEGSPATAGTGGETTAGAASQGSSGARASNANGGTPSGGLSNGSAGVAGSGGAGRGPGGGGGSAGGTAGNAGGQAGRGHGGGGGSGGGGTGAGGTSGHAGAAGSGGLPACVGNDDASAPFVDFAHSADPTPVAMGGAIASGTYFLTHLTYYRGTPVKADCLLEPMHEVLRVSSTSDTEGSMLSTVQHRFSDGTGQFGNVQSFSYKAQGGSLLIDYTCWEPDEYSQRYSATNNQILFVTGPFDSGCDDGVTLVSTYDKQP